MKKVVGFFILFVFLIFKVALPNYREEAYLNKQSSFGHKFDRLSKRGWDNFWNNKKVSFPTVAALGATVYNLCDLVLKKHDGKLGWEDKSFKEKASDCKVGLGGLAALPILYTASKILKYQFNNIGYKKNVEEHLKESGNYDQLKLPFRAVEIFKVPMQDDLSDCGYWALYYATRFLKNDMAGIFDKDKYERISLPWKKAVLKNRKERGLEGFSWLYSSEMEGIIVKDKIKSLREFHKIENQDFYLKKDFSIIDSVDKLRQGIEEGNIPYYDIVTIKNFARFKKYGKKQIVILNTGGHYICVEISRARCIKRGLGIKIRVCNSLNSTSITSNYLDKLCYLIEIINVS